MRLPSRLRPPSLRTRVAVGAFLLLLIGLAAAMLSAAVEEHELIEESAKADYADYARGLAVMARDDLAAGELRRVESHVGAAFDAAGGDVAYVAVDDADGRPVVAAGRPLPSSPVVDERVVEVGEHPTTFLHEEGHVFEIGVPVVEGTKRLGAVRMGVSTKRMNAGVAALLRSSLLPAALGVAFFALLAFYVDARLRGALRRFIAATRRMAEGRLDKPVEVRTGDDLEELARNFNRMAEALREREDELRRTKETLEAAVRDRTVELSRQKTRLDTIVDAVGAGMLLLDSDMRVLWANRVAEEWFGKDLVGRACPWVGGDGARSCGRCPSRAAAASGRAEVADSVSLDVDGSRRHFTVISSPLRGEDGSTEVLELLLDVTRRKETEAELLQAAKLASLGEVTGGVAHEIGNPLAIVNAKTKLLLAALREGRTPERLVADLEKIEAHTERIARIAGRLLAFSRRSPGDRGRLRVEDALRESLPLLDHHVAAPRVRVDADFAADSPEIVACRAELVQVFVNLAQNAMDAMPRGGSLRIASRSRDGGVETCFEDDGEGMPEAVRRRVFDPFFTTKPPGRGTGLGLSISQRIVRDHGGRITAESRREGGSVFRVWLPAAPEAVHA